jgi:hypothetical protein
MSGGRLHWCAFFFSNGWKNAVHFSNAWNRLRRGALFFPDIGNADRMSAVQKKERFMPTLNRIVKDAVKQWEWIQVKF